MREFNIIERVMKKLLISAGCAGFLTFAYAAASIASSNDPRTLPDAPQSLKCAVYKGDPGIRHHTPAEVRGRECESYWADDTDEDRRELAAIEHAASAALASAQH